MSTNTLLNVKQVAQYLQLKESTIYSWAQDGKYQLSRSGVRGGSADPIWIRGWSAI